MSAVRIATSEPSPPARSRRSTYAPAAAARRLEAQPRQPPACDGSARASSAPPPRSSGTLRTAWRSSVEPAASPSEPDGSRSAAARTQSIAPLGPQAGRSVVAAPQKASRSKEVATDDEGDEHTLEWEASEAPACAGATRIARPSLCVAVSQTHYQRTSAFRTDRRRKLRQGVLPRTAPHLFSLSAPRCYNVQLHVTFTMSLSDVSRGYVTVDGVMGGRSTGGAAWQNGGIRFEGNVNTYGGGFAYLVLQFSVALDLSGQSGLLFEYDTLPYSTYGSAPIAVQVSLESSKRCSLTGAFAIPTTASTQRTKEWVPFSRFEPKGSHWSYSKSRTGVPSSCSGRHGRLARHGDPPDLLPGRPVACSSTTSGSSTRRSPRRCRAAAGVPTAALTRRSLIDKSGAGVARQMHGLANVAPETAARQSARAGLLAAIDGAFDNPPRRARPTSSPWSRPRLCRRRRWSAPRPRRRRRRRRARRRRRQPAAAVVPSAGAGQHGVPAAAAFAAAAAAAAAVRAAASSVRRRRRRRRLPAALPLATTARGRPPDRRRREHHPRAAGASPASSP